MKKYNIFIVSLIIILVFIIFITNVIFTQVRQVEKNKEYIVEINRLMSGIDVNDLPTLEGYNYLVKIDYIAISDVIGTKELLEGKGVRINSSYTTRLIYQGDEIIGNLRIEYDVFQEFDSIIILYNTASIVFLAIILFILIYIKYYILRPFNAISNLPIELSHGMLKGDIKESKNLFFGKFIWGLNILKESMALQKERELELEKEKKMMILSISHDIKTPLSSIKLYAKAINDNLYEDELKKKKALHNIGEGIKQIEGFIQEIIKTSTTDLFSIDVLNGEFYLKDVIGLLQRNYIEKLDLIKTEFIIDKYNNILLKGDGKRLNEVLENIMENAIKYGDGQRIHISFGIEEDRQIIIVTNSGIGLEEAEVIHMFDSFWRGSNSLDKPGSGLGLYICKQIMQKMNGEIYVNSANNQMSIALVVTKL